MDEKIEKLKNEAERARLFYQLGTISREEAAERIRPYADVWNEKSKELAEKYHQKAGCFSLSAYLR